MTFPSSLLPERHDLAPNLGKTGLSFRVPPTLPVPHPFQIRPPALIDECSHSSKLRPQALQRRMLSFRSRLGHKPQNTHIISLEENQKKNKQPTPSHRKSPVPQLRKILRAINTSPGGEQANYNKLLKTS
jgi:hypothetical protein